MPKQKPLSWTPERWGSRYCSPACGRGCSHEEFLEATALAERMVQELGPGWSPVVHENLGWHFHARHGTTGVLVYNHGGARQRRYWATTGHEHHPQVQAHGSTPKAAVSNLAKRAAEESGKMRKLWQGLLAAVG